MEKKMTVAEMLALFAALNYIANTNQSMPAKVDYAFRKTMASLSPKRAELAGTIMPLEKDLADETKKEEATKKITEIQQQTVTVHVHGVSMDQLNVDIVAPTRGEQMTDEGFDVMVNGFNQLMSIFYQYMII